MTRTLIGVLIFFLGGFATLYAPKSGTAKSADPPLRLGKFSISLTVKDIAASRAFYEKLGFKVVSGEQAKKWLVLQNETATIGLFQGMLEKNSLLFNPGWDQKRATLPNFEDVRDIQKALKKRGLTFTTTADESTTGPASFSLLDPDGNPIFIDQYVPSPRK